MQGNPIAWFEIYVQDIDRAQRFYETVLETTLAKLDSPVANIEMRAFPCDRERYGATGALVKMEGVPSGGNSTLVYFHSADCGVEEARVTAAGGRIKQSKMPIGEYGFISLVYDTEGNLFGLHSMQ